MTDQATAQPTDQAAAPPQPSASPRRALIVAHEPDGPGSQVTERFRQRGFTTHNHVVTADQDKPNDAVPFPTFADYDVVVLMGSIRSLTRKDEIDTWVHEELRLIQDQVAADRPLLGICFGAQLLADAMGGEVEEAPVTEIGWTTITPVGDQINPVGPGPWLEWHHDRFTPPPESTVYAESEHAVQLFQVGRSVGTQFHPEIDVPHVAEWLQNADDDYLASHGVDQAKFLESVVDHEERNIVQCHALVDWFIDEVAFA